MKFIINVLVDDYLNQHNLSSFLKNIKEQNGVKYQLVLKKNSSINGSILDEVVKKDSLIQVVNNYSDVQLNQNEKTYWLNLSVGDALLPNAMLQWKTIIHRHPAELLISDYLNNQQDLQSQLGDKLILVNEVYIDTMKSLLGISLNTEVFDIPLNLELKMILGLQQYQLRDTVKRHALAFTMIDFLGKNVLFHVKTNDLDQMDNGITKYMVDKLVNIPSWIQVKMPTLILSPDDHQEFIKEIIKLFNDKPIIMDENLLSEYNSFAISELAIAVKMTNKLNNVELKKKLKNIVNNLSAAEKRQLTLKKPFSIINQYLGRD